MQTINPCVSDVIKLDLNKFNTGFAVGDALGLFNSHSLPYDLEVVLWVFFLLLLFSGKGEGVDGTLGEVLRTQDVI